MVSGSKKSNVIGSINKLLSLGVAEKEIVGNLTDVGLKKDEAIELIKEAKNGPSDKTDSGEEEVFDTKSKKMSLDDQIAKQLGFKNEKDRQEHKENLKDTKEEKEKKVIAITNNIDTGLKVKESVPKEKNSEKKNRDPIAELQKELNLVPSNKEKEKPSEEMKEIEKLIKKEKPKPIDNAIKNVSSSEFEDLWKKGIVVSINSKLAEMKKLKEEIDSSVQEKVDDAVKKELKQFKVLIDSQKDLIISSNKEALEEKQKEITFIIDSKIAELKKQSAELGEGVKKIQGAKKEQEESLQAIKTVLDEAKKTKSQLLVEMNSELIKAKSDAQAFIDGAGKHLNELDERVNKTLELEKNIAEGMVQEAEQKIENLTIKKTEDLVEKVEVKLNNLATMEKTIDPKKIEEKINLLEEFKKQFLENMQENLTKINSAIGEINEKNEAVDKLIQSKTLAIDAKLEELTKFEKDLTEKLEKLLKK